MAGCSCSAGLGNTGTPTCFPIATVAKKLILVPTYDSTGALNSIDVTDTLDAAYLTARINDVDASKRWFPLAGTMENVTSERADSITESAPSGKIAFIKKGVRSFSGEMWSQSPQYVGKLEEARCVDVSAYVIDGDGNIMGTSSKGSDLIYPIKIDKNSLDARLINATDTTVQKVQLTFNWDDTVKDEDIFMLTDADYTFDALAAKGLLDICVDYSSITTTGFVASLYTIYGSKKTPAVDAGLVIGDFALYNNTSAASVTITSVTESPNGTYTFVIPAQTSADVMVLTPSKDGRDYSDVVATTILVP